MYATTSTIHQQSESFDIRNFSDRLTPTKEKNRYSCPVCDGHNLTIEPKTGKYQCWNGCECKDIREAIAPLPSKERFTPWAERQKSYQSQPSTRSKPKPPPVPAGEASGKNPSSPEISRVKLTTLNAPATDIPQPQPLTKKLKGIPRSATETIYNYSYLTKPITEIENPATEVEESVTKLGKLATKVEESVTEVGELATETGETIAEVREPVRDLQFNNVPIRFWTILIDFNWLASILFLRQTLTEVGEPFSEFGESDTEVRKPDTKPAGLPSQWVVRYEWEDPNSKKGRDKTFRQWHRLPDGTPEMKKGDKPWCAYRIEEAIASAKLITSGIPAMLWQEGEKCVEIARKIAIASLTMQGSAWGKADIERNLTEIKTEVPLSVQVLLADADKTGQKKAQTFYDACTELGMPCVIIFPSDICGDLPDNANDIEQILANMDVKEFIRRLEAQIHEAVDGGIDDVPPYQHKETWEELSPLARKVNRIREMWKERIAFNEMTMDIEFDGQPMEWDTLRIDIVEKLNITMSQADAEQTVRAIARDSYYHPVRDYLESVAARYPYNPERLENLAKLFFGTEKPIYDIFMKKWLVAGVARILDPGCKIDDSLVIHGEQGVLKSTFFREMAVKDEWFLDSIDLSESEKDTLMKLHKSWITELGEIETLTTKREDAWWKNFSARREDTFRPPYGRQPKTMKRGFVIVGTTNREEFLNDPTGNRRFWIIPVGNKRINIELVQLLRDELWANAVHAYRTGDVQPFLNDEENRLRALENSRFQIDDPWEGLITQYLLPKVQVTIPEIATSCLRIDIDKQDKRLQGRIADVIRKLGWVKNTRRINGKPTKCWVRPEETLSPPSPTDNDVGTHGGNSLEPLSDKDFNHNEKSVTTVTIVEGNFENFENNSKLQNLNLNLDVESENPNLNQNLNVEYGNQNQNPNLNQNLNVESGNQNLNSESVNQNYNLKVESRNQNQNLDVESGNKSLNLNLNTESGNQNQNQEENQNHSDNNFGKVASEVVTGSSQNLVESLHSNAFEVSPHPVTTPSILKGCDIPVWEGAWVKCYPTYEHAQNGWEIRAQIVELKVENGYFNGCIVRYFDRKKQQDVDVKLPGGSGDWLLANLN